MAARALFIIAALAVIAMAATAYRLSIDEQIYQLHQTLFDEDEDYDYALQATYTVKSGDSLSAIASKYGCTVKELCTINNISDPNKIYVGQVITLCSSDPAPSDKIELTTQGWNAVRSIFGSLSQVQVDNINLLIKEMNAVGYTRPGAAYLLATAKWETAHTLEPVREAYWKDENWRKNNLRYYPYYGRGYVQLTWQENYASAGSKLGYGQQFVNNPDMVLKADISAKIIARGMRDGWFTGKKLSDFCLPNGCSADARRIINGTDKMYEIHAIYQKFLSALNTK